VPVVLTVYLSINLSGLYDHAFILSLWNEQECAHKKLICIFLAPDK